MEEPDSERRADADERREPPDFDALTAVDDLVSGDRTRDDFFDAILGLNSPATAGEVANLAGHGDDAAREYLAWFERMGIVSQVTESPATYERNQEYLNWRRSQELREQYSTEELVDFLEAAAARDKSFAEEFDVESPNSVAITAHASDTDRAIEDVWDDLAAWRTVRRRIELLERALRTGPEDTAGDRSVA